MNELIIDILIWLFIAVVLIPFFFSHLLKASIAKRKGMNSSGAGVSNGFIFNADTGKFEADNDKGTK